MESLPITVLLLARDEAARLDHLLPRLEFAREVVVVVDAATRDGTREVAARHRARLFERALDGFGPQRRFALAQAREPWVLWLDADERLDEAGIAAIREAIARGDAAGYRLVRHTWFLGRRIRHCGWRGEKVLRLFRRDAARFDDAPVHERVEVAGAIADLDATIEHRSYERWEDCRVKLERYAAAGAARARREGRRAGPLDLIARPPLRFLRMYVLQAGFLDGARGVAVCALASAQVLLKYAELWARPHEAPPVPGDRDRPSPGARD
jgi:glycosyltransferase involved in cell wall biosynthesis